MPRNLCDLMDTDIYQESVRREDVERMVRENTTTLPAGRTKEDALSYSIEGSSGHSGAFYPQLVMEDSLEPTSRWCSPSGHRDHFLLLKLTKPALLRASTTPSPLVHPTATSLTRPQRPSPWVRCTRALCIICASSRSTWARPPPP